MESLPDTKDMKLDIVPRDTAIITSLKGWRMSGVVELEEGLVVSITERRIPQDNTEPEHLKRVLVHMAREDVKYNRAEILLEKV